MEIKNVCSLYIDGNLLKTMCPKADIEINTSLGIVPIKAELSDKCLEEINQAVLKDLKRIEANK